MSSPDTTLHNLVRHFADEISDLLCGVFGRSVTVDVKELRDRIVVRLEPPLPLTINDDKLATLAVEFRCTWDSAGIHLAVEKSTIKLTACVDRAPIFRFEYEREANSKPSGHIQVHGHRGALSHLLSRASHGSPHSMEALHLPVGGPRFRPCLEDVVQFLIEDCGFEARPGWRSYVEAGRERWRRRQLRAAVRDAPDVAAEELRAVGYLVEEPDGGHSGNGAVNFRRW